jgi:hypothetical protein
MGDGSFHSFLDENEMSSFLCAERYAFQLWRVIKDAAGELQRARRFRSRGTVSCKYDYEKLY